MVTPDVIYPVRAGVGEYLRYSLRSLANTPHGEVVLSGFAPSWSTCRQLKGTRDYNSFIDSSNNVMRAMQDESLSDDVIWMMDDVYILRPMEEIPVLHRGELERVIKSYGAGARSRYLMNMQRTLDLLRELGISDPLCYELHVPLVVNRHAYQQMREVLPASGKLWEFSRRTLYGNLNNIGGEKSQDVKVTSKNKHVPSGRFVSSSATSWHGRVGRGVRLTFPHPCKWEKPLNPS